MLPVAAQEWRLGGREPGRKWKVGRNPSRKEETHATPAATARSVFRDTSVSREGGSLARRPVDSRAMSSEGGADEGKSGEGGAGSAAGGPMSPRSRQQLKSIKFLLKVRLIGAHGLKSVQMFGTQDPYVEIQCCGKKKKSKTHFDGGTEPSTSQHTLQPQSPWEGPTGHSVAIRHALS